MHRQHADTDHHNRKDSGKGQRGHAGQSGPQRAATRQYTAHTHQSRSGQIAARLGGCLEALPAKAAKDQARRAGPQSHAPQKPDAKARGDRTAGHHPEQRIGRRRGERQAFHRDRVECVKQDKPRPDPGQRDQQANHRRHHQMGPAVARSQRHGKGRHHDQPAP